MAEEEEEGEGGGAEGWLVSYADLMTLLFAAFVVLYGTIVQGTNPAYIGMSAAVRETFTEFAAISLEDDLTAEQVKEGSYTFKAFSGETNDQIDIHKGIPKSDVFVKITRDSKLVESFLDRMATEKGRMDMALRSAMIADKNEKGIIIKLVGAYFFNKYQYRLTKDGRGRVKKIGELLKKLKRRVLIEGHTGGEVSKGRYKSEDIGAMRAAYAARILVKEAGILPYMVDTVSYGDRRPIGDPGTTKGMAKNRRIEIKLYYH